MRIQRYHYSVKRTCTFFSDIKTSELAMKIRFLRQSEAGEEISLEKLNITGFTHASTGTMSPLNAFLKIFIGTKQFGLTAS